MEQIQEGSVIWEEAFCHRAALRIKEVYTNRLIMTGVSRGGKVYPRSRVQGKIPANSKTRYIT